MKRISMLDFRVNAERILAQVQKGECMILTRRGKPVARLEPILDDSDDPFYSLADVDATRRGRMLSNSQIDELLYG